MFCCQVYNGVLTNSARVGRYCGDEPPPVIETSGNTARILFRTDGSVSNGGFQAYYSSYGEACKLMFLSKRVGLL